MESSSQHCRGSRFCSLSCVSNPFASVRDAFRSRFHDVSSLGMTIILRQPFHAHLLLLPFSTFHSCTSRFRLSGIIDHQARCLQPPDVKLFFKVFSVPSTLASFPVILDSFIQQNIHNLIIHSDIFAVFMSFPVPGLVAQHIHPSFISKGQ